MGSAARILIVEDEEVLAENLKTYLSRQSADVRIACDASHALAMAESFAPDVVVLDYGLPDLNGFKTYMEISRLCARPVACVMISGYPGESIAAYARACGIGHFLAKPFSFSELQLLLDRCAGDADLANGVQAAALPGEQGAAALTPSGNRDRTQRYAVGFDRRGGERRTNQRPGDRRILH